MKIFYYAHRVVEEEAASCKVCGGVTYWTTEYVTYFHFMHDIIEPLCARCHDWLTRIENDNFYKKLKAIGL